MTQIMIDWIYIWAGFILTVSLALLLGYYLGLYTALTEVNKTEVKK